MWGDRATGSHLFKGGRERWEKKQCAVGSGRTTFAFRDLGNLLCKREVLNTAIIPQWGEAAFAGRSQHEWGRDTSGSSRGQVSIPSKSVAFDTNPAMRGKNRKERLGIAGVRKGQEGGDCRCSLRPPGRKRVDMERRGKIASGGGEAQTLGGNTPIQGPVLRGRSATEDEKG